MYSLISYITSCHFLHMCTNKLYAKHRCHPHERNENTETTEGKYSQIKRCVASIEKNCEPNELSEIMRKPAAHSKKTFICEPE